VTSLLTYKVDLNNRPSIGPNKFDVISDVTFNTVSLFGFCTLFALELRGFLRADVEFMGTARSSSFSFYGTRAVS
jgi:hypothetical protein